jgi:opacity protein-like surface antigen
MKRKLAILVCVVFVLGTLSTGSSWAGRPDKTWKNWFGHLAGGWDVASGDFGNIVDDTWTLSGGATWWPETSPVGLDIDLAWQDFDVSKDAIRRINEEIGTDPGNDGEINNGDVSIWSLTTDVIWSPNTQSKVGFYLVGGIGVYRLEGQLTSQGLVYYPPICDPWLWWCYPGGVGPGTIIEERETATEFGYNAGIGINFELASGSQVYVEAKYHAIQTDNRTTEYIPVQVGFRWSRRARVRTRPRGPTTGSRPRCRSGRRRSSPSC